MKYVTYLFTYNIISSGTFYIRMVTLVTYHILLHKQMFHNVVLQSTFNANEPAGSVIVQLQ